MNTTGVFFTQHPMTFPTPEKKTSLSANPCAGMDPPLANFRSVPMKINGKEIVVSGMRHPDHQGNLTIAATLAQLRKTHDVLISLEAREDNGESVRKVWEQYGGKYHLCHVTDFTPSKLTQMKKIHQIVADAAQKKQSVVIHCGEGWGRTGTALSALMLTSLLQQSPEKNDLRKTSAATPSHSRQPTKTTPLVAKAISEVRKQDKIANQLPVKNLSSSNGESVELEKQVQCLYNFQILQAHSKL